MRLIKGILFCFVIFLGSCSYIDDSNLDLYCTGTHTHTLKSNGKESVTEVNENISLHFRDKRMYNVQYQSFISPRCEKWTSELIICQKNDDEKSEQYGMQLTIDRKTGEYTYFMPFRFLTNIDNDLYKGRCEQMKNNKI